MITLLVKKADDRGDHAANIIFYEVPEETTVKQLQDLLIAKKYDAIQVLPIVHYKKEAL